MEFTSYDELIYRVKQAAPKRVAIASAADEHTLEAALYAHQEKIAIPIFIGDKGRIIKLLHKHYHTENEFEIIHEDDNLRTPYIACQLVHEGKADFIMKGFIDTSDFLHGILDKEVGLRTGNPMSHIAFLQIPGYRKLLAVTDGGMITAPDYQGKVQILENAVSVLKGMGYELPKAAILTAVEKTNKAMPETLDAAKLQKANETGLIKDCIIEGPISYDIAISKDAAALKGFHGKYCEEYDIFLVPNISAGNLLCKALIYNAGAKMSGFVTGAKVPLVVNSRSSSSEEKYYAIALAAASCLHI